MARKNIYILLLLFLFMAGGANALEEKYEYRYLFTSPPGNFAFYYYEPFFFNSDDIAFHYYVTSKEFKTGLKKWSFNDYKLAFGFNYFLLVKFNRDARYDDGYNSVSSDYNGNYQGWELYSTVDLNERWQGKLAYSFRYNRYFQNDLTPAGYVLPLDNANQAIKLSLYNEGRQEGFNNISHQVVDIEYNCSDRQSVYGLNGNLKQFEKILLAKAKSFWAGRTKIGDGLFGVTVFGAAWSYLRLGNPQVSVDEYDDIMYGFPEKDVKLDLGVLNRFELKWNNFYLTNSFLLYHNGEVGGQFADGLGVGLGCPVSLPFIGLYQLKGMYYLAWKELKETYNRQFIISLYSSQLW